MAIGSKKDLRNRYILLAEGEAETVGGAGVVEIPIEVLDAGQFAFYDFSIVPDESQIFDAYQGVGAINTGAGNVVSAGVHATINFRRQFNVSPNRVSVLLSISSDTAGRKVRYKVYRKAGLD